MKIHFVGIGGIGMSGLARYFKNQGFAISGSDGAKSIITDSLRKENIQVKIGHKKENVPNDATLVVYNRAIPLANPELVAAREKKISVVPYAQVLGRLTEEYNTIAITGSHGKSTTTAIAALTLIQAGFDPTVLVGTNVKEFSGKNIRFGKSAYLVLEADDYGAAFLEYFPVISIVTNIDREHMDFYKSFSAVKKAFLQFMARTQEGGALILNRDDKPLCSLAPQIKKIAGKRKLKVIWYSSERNKNSSSLRKVMKISGKHNLSNATAVVALAELLKISKKKTLAAIGSYQGAWRRMEYRGKFGRALVYDDYAHHPTEIKATLQAFREKFPHSSLVCVFQPHQAKRLQTLFKDFLSAFTDADTLIVIPSYTVAGRDTANSKYTAEYLAEMLKKKNPKKTIYYLSEPKKIRTLLGHIEDLKIDKKIKNDPVIIMMGAGNIIAYTDLLK